MYHIVFLAPYSSSIPLIEQVFLARPDCDELFYEIILDRYNNQLEHIHADAVIARGFTARTMKRLNIPGVELSVSGYDVVQAIDRAVKGWPGTRIALIGAQNLLDGAETISSIFSGRDRGKMVYYRQYAKGRRHKNGQNSKTRGILQAL